MIRSFVVCGAVLFLACTDTALGLCENDSGCLPGLRCQEGVCVGCGGDDQCLAWEACSENRRCELRAGRCETQAQCNPGEVCGADHVCVIPTGACQSAAGCQAWEVCNAETQSCEPQEGRCTSATDCGAGSLWAQTCGADNWCHEEALPDNDVVLWGTLAEGAGCYDAVSSILAPTRVRIGFGCSTASPFDDAVVLPDGRILYVDHDVSPSRLKIFAPDRFRMEGKDRVYPRGTTAANDTVVASPGCAETENVASVVVQAGTGQIAYNCGPYFYEGGNTFYDVQGQVVQDGRRLLAWNAGDSMLAQDGFTRLFVLSPTTRTVIPVTGMPPVSETDTLDARAHPTGFHVALQTSDDAQQLWHIDNDGVATLKVTYGAFPERIYARDQGTLDTTGALYVRTWGMDSMTDDVIVMLPADGAPGTVVYSEASAPDVVSGAGTFSRPFNYIHSSRLFAGP